MTQKRLVSPPAKDAATLILTRQDSGKTSILMGKRSGSHDFMPGKYVFPGGQVDPQDSRAISHSALTPLTQNRLRFRSRRQPRAFAMAAIRETFEETGLVLGRPAHIPRTAPKGWEHLYAMGIAPDLALLRFIGRAITPPHLPKRFDARFFLADSEKILTDKRTLADSMELYDLKWVSLQEALALDVPKVTRFMIREVDDRLTHGDDPGPPFLRWHAGKHVMDRIQCTLPVD